AIDDARRSGLARLGVASLRGAVPVSAPAASTAAGTHGVRHLAGGEPEHRRLLPRSAAGGDSLARAPTARPRLAAGRLVAAAVGETARAAAAAAAGPRPDPGPHPRASRPVQ